MADAILKTCRKCGLNKTLSDFRLDKRGSDGYWPRCKMCDPHGSRASATCGVCGQPKALSEPCLPCARRTKAAYKIRHADRVREADAAYRREKMERTADERAERRRKSRDRSAKNKRRIKAEWKLRNPGSVNASTAQRFAAKMQATPGWADRKAIERLYVEAAARGMHVDHIVPLRSPLVCGLHCEANLQLLPPFENISKGNRRWPDMWE